MGDYGALVGQARSGPSTQTRARPGAAERRTSHSRWSPTMTGSSGRVRSAARSVAVHGLLGLAAAELPLDHDHVEEAREIELLDLPPLLSPVPIGDEGERHPATRGRPSVSGTAGKKSMRSHRRSA